jgi:hypothetical protein
LHVSWLGLEDGLDDGGHPGAALVDQYEG